MITHLSLRMNQEEITLWDAFTAEFDGPDGPVCWNSSRRKIVDVENKTVKFLDGYFK